MSLVERPLTGFEPADSSLKAGSRLTSLNLKGSVKARLRGFTWTLTFPLHNSYRILVTGPDRPRPPHDNVIEPTKFLEFEVVSIDRDECRISLSLPEADDYRISGLEGARVVIQVSWRIHVAVTVVDLSDGQGSVIMRDLAARSYGLTEHGMIRHWKHDPERVHLGLGEKAAPIDLTGRSFQIHATDAGEYDAYKTDPLYKHTPFLMSTPRPTSTGKQDLTYAIYNASNSNGLWDVGREIDFPSGGWSMSYTQHWGGIEEWIILGKGVQNVVETFAELAGKPKLVGRDWLGYLASSMLLSDVPNAQEELSKWPELCKEHDIPCSAMHFSSGFTIDEASGRRFVFHLNKKMYPDFAAMVKVYHEAGMLVVPNVKPYILESHPDYARLEKLQGLFLDPLTNGPSKQNLWSHSMGYSYEEGSWIDLTAQGTRQWWAEGCKSLIDLGVDGIWNDNSEFFTRDDTHLCKNDFDHKRTSECMEGVMNIGLMGRMTGNEMMGKVSNDALRAANPERRTYVLTRSGNPASFKYACSTWSGDNNTSWHNMRGSQAIQLNSALSLMQSAGADVGGFAGPLPGPELFVRWIQLGVTHSRFCIHSAPRTPDGEPKLNSPWEYPEVLDIVRETIKWRYTMLPFINNLMWQSHLHAQPQNAPLFYGSFSTDPALYTTEALEGFDAWMGVGQILSAPAMWESQTSKDVYFPRSSQDDATLYFDLHPPYQRHRSGTTAHVATPMEHGGLFAREGSIIPIGKAMATITAIEGPARTHTDGVNTVLQSQGGVVALDDWRGVRIFPGEQGSYAGEWIEDDGISSDPATYIVHVDYTATKEKITIDVKVKDNGFTPLWAGKLYFVLPIGDTRPLEGGIKRQILDTVVSQGWKCHVLVA